MWPRLALLVAVLVLGWTAQATAPNTRPGAGQFDLDFSTPGETAADEVFEDIWEALRGRRVRSAPPIGCPVATERELLPNVRAIGDGPVYLAAASARWRLSSAVHTDGWYSRRLVFLASPSYTGPTLVRVQPFTPRTMAGFGVASFGVRPEDELRLGLGSSLSASSVPDDWRIMAGSLAVSGPGCYALQIDGLTFSRQIVLEALP